MDTQEKIQAYQKSLSLHRKSVSELSVLLAPDKSLFISTTFSDVLFPVLIGELYYHDLREVIEKIRIYHCDRITWCNSQIELLNERSIGQG